MQRKGYLYNDCATLVKNEKNIFAACMVACGDGDALITGVTKNYADTLDDVMKAISAKQNNRLLGYSIMLTKDSTINIADNYITEYPTSTELAQIAVQTAEIAKTMGMASRVALLSFSDFGSADKEKILRIRDAVKILDNMKPNFEYDGEMSVNAALDTDVRKLYSFCRLTNPANILIMPGLNTAAISTELLQKFSNNIFIGPITNGFEYPVQILQPTATASEILKITTFAYIEAVNKLL